VQPDHPLSIPSRMLQTLLDVGIRDLVLTFNSF